MELNPAVCWLISALKDPSPVMLLLCSHHCIPATAMPPHTATDPTGHCPQELGTLEACSGCSVVKPPWLQFEHHEERFSRKSSMPLDGDLIISSDQPGEEAEGDDFSPHSTGGETEVSGDHWTWPRSENSLGTELGANPRPALQDLQAHQLAEENSSGRGRAAAGMCRLVYFGAEGHFITSWNHRMLTQTGPQRSSDSTPLF